MTLATRHPSFDGLFRITTALSRQDYERFTQITQANKVTVSAYLRGMVTDVIVEEEQRTKK